jgi:enoyl-CoA hydratase/carnithine racemase
MELALMCDLIIASKEAKFSQPEVNLGLIPGIGGSQRLKHYLGKFNANYLCLSGEMITANRAYELGLVSILLEKNNFFEETEKVVKKIAEKPKSSLIEIKKLISKNEFIENGLKEERETFYSLLDHENAKIGLNAFLKKIKPDWKD